MLHVFFFAGANVFELCGNVGASERFVFCRRNITNVLLWASRDLNAL
jgi:hypothetical protein